MSKPGVFREAIDNDQNGEDILLKSKIKLEQKGRSKRTKKIDGDIKDKICLNRHGNDHVVESRGDRKKINGTRKIPTMVFRQASEQGTR